MPKADWLDKPNDVEKPNGCESVMVEKGLVWAGLDPDVSNAMFILTEEPVGEAREQER